MAPYRTPDPPREPPTPARPFLCRVWLHLWSASFDPEVPMHGTWILYCTRCDKKIYVHE